MKFTKIEYYISSKIELQRQETGRRSSGTFHQNLSMVHSNRISKFHKLIYIRSASKCQMLNWFRLVPEIFYGVLPLEHSCSCFMQLAAFSILSCYVLVISRCELDIPALCAAFTIFGAHAVKTCPCEGIGRIFLLAFVLEDVKKIDPIVYSPLGARGFYVEI